MTGKIVIRMFAFALLIFWMAVICAFSSQDSGESSAVSGAVTRVLAEFFGGGLGNMSESEKAELISSISGPVRKAAHFTEFAILGGLGVLAASTVTGNRRIRFCAPLILCAVWAVQDEIHQLFVPGRSGQITDVLIDTAGGLAGVCTALLIASAALKIKRGRDESLPG